MSCNTEPILFHKKMQHTKMLHSTIALWLLYIDSISLFPEFTLL
jgi:hypothetical protein